MPEDRTTGQNQNTSPSSDSYNSVWPEQPSEQGASLSSDTSIGEGTETQLTNTDPTISSQNDSNASAEVLLFDREPATNASVQQVESENGAVPMFSQPDVSVTNVQRNSKKGLAAAIISGAVLLLVGGTAAGYNVWYQNPDKVIGDAISNAVTAKSVSADSTMNSTTGTGKEATSYELKLKTVSDMNDLRADVSFNSRTEDTTFDMSGSVMVRNTNKFYVKVNKLKELLEQSGLQALIGSSPSIDALVKQLDGRWVVIDSTDIEETTGSKDKASQCVEDTVSTLRKDSEYSGELETLYKKFPLVGVKKSLGSKDGSLGYEVEFKRENAIQFANGVNSTKFYKQLKKCDDKIQDLNGEDMFKQESDSKDEGQVVMWIDRWTHKLTSLELSSRSKDSTAKLVVDTEFDIPVSVDEPKNALTVDDIKKDIEAVQQDMMQSYNTSATDQTIDSTYNFEI